MPCFSESSSKRVHTLSRRVTSSTGVSFETIEAKSWMSAKSTETAGSVSATMVPGGELASRSVMCGGSMLSRMALDTSRLSRSCCCKRKSRRSARSRTYPP